MTGPTARVVPALLPMAAMALALAVLAWPAAPRFRLAGAGARRGPAPRARRPTPSAWGGPALSAVVVAAAGTLTATVLVGVLAGCCAALGARSWRRRRERARVDRALAALAELLGALSAELRSGRPALPAVEAALRSCLDEDCRGWVGPALRAAVRGDPAGGGPVGADAVAGRLATGEGPPPPDRAFAEALARALGAVRLSSRTGCSLAAVLASVEDDLRARLRHGAEARAATAGPRASAWLLAGLPALALAMGSGVGADPWRVLTTTPAGQFLLVTGVALEIGGVTWSARLVRRALR